MEECYPKNVCLNVFKDSLCIYVALDKLPSMDWIPLYRLDPRCDDRMIVLVMFCISYYHAFPINFLNDAFLKFGSMSIVLRSSLL